MQRRRAVVVATVIALVFGLSISACASKPPTRPNATPPSSASKNATDALVGTWVPSEPQTLQSLQFERDGTLLQQVGTSGTESTNTGTWSIDSPGVLFFAFPGAKGFGVPVARYTYSIEESQDASVLDLKWAPDSRTLEGAEHWVPWITGSDHPEDLLTRN